MYDALIAFFVVKINSAELAAAYCSSMIDWLQPRSKACEFKSCWLFHFCVFGKDSMPAVLVACYGGLNVISNSKRFCCER